MKSRRQIWSLTLPSRQCAENYLKELVRYFILERGMSVNDLKKRDFPGGRKEIQRHLEILKGEYGKEKTEEADRPPGGPLQL